MSNKESTKRLLKAYRSDPYIQDIKRRIAAYMAISAKPFDKTKPEAVKMYLKMIENHSQNEYPWLSTGQNTKSDMAMAMGWAMVVHQEKKLLETKARTDQPVLACIDYRLTLFKDYQQYWLDHTDFEVLPLSSIYFKLYLNIYPEPAMPFNHWLYANGYEWLLSDKEFLSVIKDFDKD
jgi:hypothetical protein